MAIRQFRKLIIKIWRRFILYLYPDWHFKCKKCSKIIKRNYPSNIYHSYDSIYNKWCDKCIDNQYF